VADVISIDEKRQRGKQEKAALIRKRKIQTVQRVFQCTHCAIKCMKCGAQTDPHDEDQRQILQNNKIPYRFCVACAEEYLDYIQRLQGQGDPDCYWQNEAWIAIWKAWIDYQGTNDRYAQTKEFKQLVQELKQMGPDR
jgi:hypothetical protein